MRRDAKKLGVLGVLALVMFAVVLKQFVLTGSPATAAAASDPLLAVRPSGVDPSGSTAASGNDLARGGGARVDPVERWLLDRIRPLDRNPFEFHPEFFPNVDAAVESPAVLVVDDELFWDRLAKSIASRADQRKQRQIRIENLQVAAGKLRVQSTIMGTNPRVLIGGTMNSVGDTVETESGGVMLQFRIVRIEGRRIILEREGVKLELPMGANRARVIVDE